jgi:hypothetical protein
MKTITIGILTYNRISICARNILKLLREHEKFTYRILVVDDGGQGELEKKIQDLGVKNKDLEIITHESNLGLTESLCDLFESCETDYLIWLPDDDHLVAKSIPTIRSFLSENSPDFVSTLFYRDGRIMRGRGNFSHIDPKDFWESSFHGAGLIYNVASVSEFIPLLRKKAQKHNYAAYMYPPEFLIINLLAHGYKCVWSDIEVAYEENSATSNLRFVDGKSYKDIISRIRQLESFESLITDINLNYRSKVAKQIHIAHRNKVISTILEELGSRAPLALKAFEDRSLFYFLKLYVKRKTVLGDIYKYIKNKL